MTKKVRLDQGLAQVARLLRALGDETRLGIVLLLGQGELCVCHVQEALGLPQPAASRHLALLRAAGVVATRREGSWIYYRLAAQEDPVRRRQLRSLLRALADEREEPEALRRDLVRLVRSRGPGRCA